MRRLRRKQIIERLPGTHRNRLTPTAARSPSYSPNPTAASLLAENDLCPNQVPPPTPASVTFVFWGSAPAGVMITYGSDTSNLSDPGLPFRAHLAYDSSASYYVATAQLQGSGVVHCKVIVSDGTSTYVKQGIASGGFNICSAQLNNEESFGNGWQ